MAKTLLEQYDEWKQKKQKEEQRASQPKYTIPDSGSILEQYQSYKQQRQAEEQKAASAKRINNPSHLGNVMIAGAVQNTQKKQAESARVAKEEEARRVKQEEKQSWNDYVQRLTDQYMPVRPDPIPQVDINKKYGPSSSRSAMVASVGVSDAPFGFGKIVDLSGDGGSMSVRNSAMEEADRERREREERDRADREAYQAALERANLGRGGKLNESSGRRGGLNLPSTGRGGALENNPANGWDYDAQKAQDIRRVEQEDELANKYQMQPTAPRQYTENETVVAAEQAKQSITELTAERDRLLKDIETLDTVLKWPVGRQDVAGYQNFTFAQAQRPQAQKALDDLNEQIAQREKEQQASGDISQVESLRAQYEAAPEAQKAQALEQLKAAEYKRDWNAMSGLEKTGVWLGDRAKKALYTINDAVYAIPDLIADVAGVDRLQWSKNNKAALKGVQTNIERQAKSTSWLANMAGDVVSEGIRMIPTILIASMTGGTSLAAQGAANIATAGAGTGAKVAQATVDMLKNPAFVNSFFNMFGLNLSQAREEGVDPATAVSMAWQKAFPSALIEMSGGYEKAAERGRGWLDWLIGSLEEGGEEFIQGITDTAVDKTFGNVFNLSVDDVVSLTNQKAIVSGARAVEEFSLGAITAGVMGGAQIGLLKGMDAITGNNPRQNETFPEDIGQRIANKEAEIAKKESEAYENAARERMGFETRDGEAAKKYSELVKLVNESFPEESETKAKIAEAVTIDTKRMAEIATSAMQELRARMQTEASPEALKLSEALTQTVEGIFAGMQTDRNAITDKYTAGLDEAVKSEIKGKNDVSYAKGYGIAHALGQMGVSLDTIAKVKSVSTLQETAKQAAEQGQAKWEAALPALKSKAADLQKALPKPGQGGVTYRANVKQEALSTLQRDQIGLLEKIAKPLGYNFVMMEFDKDAQGNYVTDKGQVAPNGFFRDSDGTIYIDVNAGKTAGRMVEDTIIPLTAGHELGHYLKATSPELFRAYSAAVVEELVSKGTDIDALIAKQIGRGKLREITVESAIEEMIMESGAMMLSNSQAAQKMAETNPGLFQKIAEWVKDFVDSIRKAFSRVDATPEAKAIMQTVNGALKYSDKLIDLWDTMAVTEAQGRADVKPATVARRDVQAVAKEAATKKTAYTSDGQAVDYHYEIAPVGSLIPSNLEISLEPNPDYPQELQPRDRTRAASQQQVEEIANKLNPALLGESADVGTGAPFVGPDMVVESGNGRILAITRAMRQGKGLTYTQWLKDNAARFGIDPAKVDNASVLVRVRDTEVNRPEFVQKANESQVATYSDSESAVSDAKKVTPAMLEMANMDSGDINSAGNSGFVSSFISKVVPVAERGRMMDASGKLSKSGENRVRTALFQMAYEDGYLTEQMAEASDDTSKNILKAMTAVAPRLALMNDAMKKGTLSDYPIGQAIAEAYRIVQRQKRLGVSVDRYINQQSLVRQDTPAHWMLLEMFNENRNAPNRMADALNSILNAAERQGNPNQMLMPGLEAERPSVEGIVRDGLNRYADEGVAASERDTLKFQMRTPVEETAKLIAVHNLSEAQLLSSVELGGFAMPSIAVLKAGQPHDRYGDISIVFGKETIDPKNSENKVYGGDAWTPSFPNIDYEISETAAQAVRKKASELLGPYYKDMRPGLDDDNMQDVINRAGGDPVKAYEDNNALKAAYLRDIGENFTPRYSELDYGSEFGNDVVKYVADRMGDKVKEALSGDRKQFMSIEPDVRKALNERDNGKFGGDVYSQPFGFGQVDRLARAVAQYMNSNGVTRFDMTETSRDIREAMKEGNHEAGYKAWLKNMFGGIVSKSGIRNNTEFFTPSGNRRSFDALHWSVTLENVVRSMKSQAGKGVDSMGGGGLFGVSTKNYNNLDDIRKDIDRLQLMDEEQYQTKKDEFRDRVIELADEIAPKSERNRFTALDRASEVLTEAARKGTTAGIQRVLNGYKDYYNIREDTAKKLYKLMSDISRMPTEYFEAKPERAVGFDEVRAVIIPDTASDSLKKALDNVSAPVIEYKADDNADRLKALNSPELDGVKFQERDTQYLAAVESGDMDTAQKMVDEAAKAAGYIVGPVYHGTSAKFNTFRRGDIGFHFGTKSQARTRSGYGRNAIVISANLNIQNPLRVSKDYGSWDADYAAKWMLEDGHITQGEYREIMNTPSSKQNKAMRELLIRKGYDGVEYVNQFEGRSPKPSYIVFSSSQAKRTDPVTYDDSGNVIPLSQRFTDSNDIRYQERDPVPAMYSKMERAIEDVFRNKSISKVDWRSLYPYLKKNGVTADEMRWSGISTFFNMDNPKTIFDVKSFSKAELLEFAKASAVQIDTIMFDEPLDEYDEENGDEFSMDDEELFGVQGDGDERRFKDYALPDGDNYRELIFTAPDLPGAFQSSHWPEDKNVLAHTRLQDFQTTGGKPVLFVEEVQSDWHEKGRELGYNQKLTDSEEAEFKVLLDKRLSKGMHALTDAEQTRYHELNAKDSNKIPEAPFATTWHEYVLKRVLRMAAEGGYDYVGWTTGKMQADRYSLAKVIDTVYVQRFEDGQYRAVPSKDGSKLALPSSLFKNEKELAATFGKDLSQKIVEAANSEPAGEMAVLRVDNASFGGDGMKAFYDIGGKSSQNIPRFLNKYGAQWGAKIQTIDMQGSENTYQVPAIEVTDAMKESVLFEGQPLYQERDPDYRTKRDILAGAFDSVAQTEGEKRNLKEYKNLIGSLNRMEEEARVLRQANTAERKKPERDKAVIEKNTKRIAEIEERINNLDKRLLKMQNAAPLQNVLKREVDYYKRQQNTLNKQHLEKYRADRAETSMKQRYRNDISKGVKSLNNTLMNESDQKHIPEGFKAAVIEFLKLFTDNTSVFDYKRLSILKEMYDALETSDSELAGMYDFDIAQDIADAARMLEGKRLSQLTEAELEKMRDIVTHFNHIVKNENQIFTQKRSVKTTDAAEEGLSEYGKKAKEMRLALLNGKNPIAAINKFLTSKNIKPMYFFKRVGGILQELFDDIRAAQGKWAFRMNEDRNFFRNTVQKYNYYKWVDDGQLTFTTARGDQITLTRDQALELYAINKREKTNKQQGAEHLAIGGFVYEDAVKVKKKSALGVPMTYEINAGENHPLTDSDLDQIGKWLTNEQRAFADEMVNYLSAVMGERGNEVSLAMYGIRKYTEKYYFPYKSASNFLYSHQGGAQDDSAIKHRSFTKRTTVSANNPVVLTGFTKVWADHVQNMNLYNAMAVPLDNFNRVYNYRIRGDKDATKAQSVKAALEAAYGKEANAYIKQLLNDVNGGIRPDKGDAEARKMMSLWKKGAVFASLSVVVQQPSAIGRALALIDPKYFRKGYTKAGYEEMMKWSGTANIKAMGRFDANMGMTAADWLTQREYTGMDEKAKAFAKDGSFRDDVLSWLPQKADEMTWTALWEAVKRETASRHGNLIGTDAFMQKVAERFDEVVDYTQVYDSVLSRSEVMRSQSALAQMVTAFMAEPTTAYNMLLDSVVNAKNKGMKNYVKPGRALGAFAVSVLLNSILKAMVTAGRDDDEKYTYLEKYLRKVSGSIADELNPLGLVPYGRDILSLWDGYDIERADMSLIGDLINAVKKMSKTDTPIVQRMDVLAGAIGNALGFPYKNVRRDIQGVYNILANTAPMSRQSVSGAKYSVLEGLPWFDASRAGYARKLYSAIVRGDAQEEAGLREQIGKIVKKDSDINAELRKIITTEFEEERLEPRTALQQMIDLTALKEIKGKIGDWYKDGLIGQDVAEQLLVEFTQDDQPNERYKTIEGWNFSKDPDNEGESYSTYKPFYDAIDSGKDLRAVVNTYMDPKKYGASKSTLSSRVTDTYKEQYIEAYRRSKTEAAALKARLLNAYVLLGYDRDKKSKDIDDWLKQ